MPQNIDTTLHQQNQNHAVHFDNTIFIALIMFQWVNINIDLFVWGCNGKEKYANGTFFYQKGVYLYTTWLQIEMNFN